jgi:hypothetical protein
MSGDVGPYTLSWHDLDTSVEWECQAPIHAGQRRRPVAMWLLLLLVSKDLAAGRVVVNTAIYQCSACRNTMECDIATDRKRAGG